jgi:hypothetical protein
MTITNTDFPCRLIDLKVANTLQITFSNNTYIYMYNRNVLSQMQMKSKHKYLVQVQSPGRKGRFAAFATPPGSDLEAPHLRQFARLAKLWYPQEQYQSPRNTTMVRPGPLLGGASAEAGRGSLHLWHISRRLKLR